MTECRDLFRLCGSAAAGIGFDSFCSAGYGRGHSLTGITVSECRNLFRFILTAGTLKPFFSVFGAGRLFRDLLTAILMRDRRDILGISLAQVHVFFFCPFSLQVASFTIVSVYL